MRMPSYCFISSGKRPVYYFRMRVPKELQLFLKRTEIKKSLRTTDQQTAYRLCREYTIATENYFAELRLKLFQASLANGNNPNTLTHLGLEPAHVITQTVSTPPRVEPEKIKLSKLIELYVKDEHVKRGSRAAGIHERNLLRFMEVVTDKPINQYTVEDSQKYLQILLKIPLRLTSDKYIGKSIKTILKREYSPEQRLSIKTVNHRMTNIATIFNWAVRNDLISSHPFNYVKLARKTSADKERPALSDDEIRKIIVNLSADKESFSWCILISCFSGLRQSEAAGLDADDIILVDDAVWCIDVNDRGDKKLKSANGKRLVPLHPMLLEAGLVKLAQSRSGGKLFPDIKPFNGKYGHYISKYFMKYRKSLNIAGAGQTYHGLRHSLISKLWSAGIPEAHTAAIAGHQRGKRESYIRYAKKDDIKPLVVAIEAIDYGNIKLPTWIISK